MSQKQSYAIVPRVPTQSMLDSVASTMDDELNGPGATDDGTRMDWASMLDAAPSFPGQVLTDEEIERVLDAAKVPEYPGCELIDIQIARAIEAAVLAKFKESAE